MLRRTLSPSKRVSPNLKPTRIREKRGELFYVLHAEWVLGKPRFCRANAFASVTPTMRATRENLNLGQKFALGHTVLYANFVGADSGTVTQVTSLTRQACSPFALILFPLFGVSAVNACAKNLSKHACARRV